MTKLIEVKYLDREFELDVLRRLVLFPVLFDLVMSRFLNYHVASGVIRPNESIQVLEDIKAVSKLTSARGCGEASTYLRIVSKHDVVFARVELAVEDTFKELQPVSLIVPERDLVHHCLGQDWFLRYRNPIKKPSLCVRFSIKDSTNPIS